MDRIAIIGLGLIGGSLGMGLKKAQLKNVEIIGHDKDADNASVAKGRGAADRIEWNIHRAVEGASMVIIATPVLTVREVLELIRDDLREGAIVTDVASTKVQVMAWARELLPETVNFVGGHPMAGKESPGVVNADPAIFKDTVWCITPGIDAHQGAIDSVAGLASTLGARPFFLDAEEHDGFVAAVSHLPMTMAAALTRTVLESPAKRELAQVAAGGFRDSSRLAGQSPVMTRDIMLTNKVNVRRWIGDYIVALEDFRDLLDRDDDEALLAYFDTAQDLRANWLVAREQGPIELGDESDMPTTGDTVRDMMFGRALGSRISQITALTRNQGNKPKP